MLAERALQASREEELVRHASRQLCFCKGSAAWNPDGFEDYRRLSRVPTTSRPSSTACKRLTTSTPMSYC
ncbi:unnamed protein product [Strongylus vulgaris]|uniref:Uncharacterized protein n=1 Tax=Strongylus vulgaris TaxID=40348 RepID=A0A3P7LRC9_STRVU|nr:unnamed protein product [Strongylus vulgaris]